MVKIKIDYEGDLHCRLTHGPSGSVMATDAPVDNMGKGATFSPTDLVAGALGACMLTIMGIVANRHQINLKGTTVEVIKEMISVPVRKIGKLTLTFHMAKGIDPKHRLMLERAAETCPVHKSLDPAIQIPTQFIYPD